MRDTDNKGVHVVLNSLAGKHQRLGLQALCSSGRFLEIGKMVRTHVHTCVDDRLSD